MPPEKAHPSHLISPGELPVWVPGKIVCASDRLGWRDIAQRTYLYKGQDVEIPPMNSFMLVQYRRGETPMDRKVDGRWTRTRCRPGLFSLLSRSAESHWNWTAGVEVSHLYLSGALMARVASDLQGKEVAGVDLHDVLQGSDPLVTHVADEVTREAMEPNVGGPLYVEALALQLAVHLLRGYASCVFKAPSGPAGLSRGEVARLEEFIDAHLGDAVALDDLARLLGMGVWTLNRHVRRTLGCSAYALVVERRMARAQRLLRGSDLALKEIAAACGFSDQAHMTRAFRAKLGVTPGQFRRDS
ncbi:transcriptional regulator, AraC family [Tistlia consotensis]|uniref:Transcriptional regulator, AraC family n=1 Tax=Tistlia consotensis USBA 355 TaxID=560819 RepID=A0A1Y6CJP5_9PROT|nr:AraC family transcriptional regulator [Tistlia consotensis]SMF59216.1 transcriptional regulator, AraC family [Tistlia consotensis USBA 355]SNR64275.1 transcriptional regulator, AraC family [Tistlia consotensis]